MHRTVLRFISLLAVVLLILGGSVGSLRAWPNEQPVALDFVTGGGWIVTHAGAMGNFGVGGGVKNGSWWGHLNYIDHGLDYHVKGTSVTAYLYVDAKTRDICGTAQTNRGENLYYRVRVTDNGEPGRDDIFGIKLSNGYMEISDLGGPGPGGGNIQLHKGNASNTAPSTPPDCRVDPFDSSSSGGGGTAVRHEETDAAISYSGTWTPFIDPRCSGGQCAISAQPAARSTFTFSGTGVTWITFRSTSRTGIANVYVDGVLAATVDTYSTTPDPQAAGFTRTGMARGTHTIAIEVTGAKNPAATEANIAVDAFDVTP